MKKRKKKGRDEWKEGEEKKSKKERRWSEMLNDE